MKTEDIAVLDAALGVFLRYGFKRATMGDIATAAGLSRQSLYARFANKDEIYAAGLELFSDRTVTDLRAAWSTSPSLSQAMDHFAAISMLPFFDMLQNNPDARDLIEEAKSTEGKAAMDRVVVHKIDALTELFAPYSDTLASKGLTPRQLAEFVETAKHAIMTSVTDRGQLTSQFAALKASVLSLTDTA